MKIIYNYMFTFLGLAILFVSCQEKELTYLNPDANTDLSLSTDALVLLEDNILEDAMTFSWTDPGFGYDAAASYNILLDFAGGDFSAPQIFIAGTDLSKTVTQGELNTKLLSMGVTAMEPTQIDAMIEIELGNYRRVYSTPVTFTVTAFSSILDLSSEWGVVGNATPGGWGSTPTTPIQDIPFWTTDTNGVLVAFATLRDGYIKFRTDNAWTLNYGDNGADGTMEEGGSDIPVTAGNYKITMNLNDLTYTVEPYSWGLVGDYNGWAAPDHKLEYNSYADDWRTVITIASDGGIKFRLNEDWGVNYGDTGADGSLETGGDNISITAGNYLVIFNLNDLTYSFESMDVWGLVGDATPNGWGGPDTKFVPDFGINEGTYYINGITLTDGFVKVRQNDAWGVNYGDNDDDGTLEEGGADKPVTAGIYNVEVNFAATPPTIGLHPWQ